jgi:hypothetical protein
MNNLSWLLYAAGALEALGRVFFSLSVALIVGYGAFYVISCISASDDHEPIPTFRPGCWVAGVLMAILACVTPSAQTVYMIAASEVGARAADTAEARELLDLLRHRVRDALSDTKKS